MECSHGTVVYMRGVQDQCQNGLSPIHAQHTPPNTRSVPSRANTYQSKQAGAETRKDMMNVLYQRSLVLLPEDVVRPQVEPPQDFLEDMDIIYGPADACMEETTTEEEGFPPYGSREDFVFDAKQVAGYNSKRGKN